MPDFKNTCSIHIRIGDYANPDSLQPVLGIDYYRKAMSHFPYETTFVVFSDEPQKASEILKPICEKEGTKMIFPNANHSITDLWLMTQCKHNIVGNSTYSWWGAWLNKNPDKKVIAPSTWWTEKAWKEWRYNTKHLFPEGWIII